MVSVKTQSVEVKNTLFVDSMQFVQKCTMYSFEGYHYVTSRLSTVRSEMVISYARFKYWRVGWLVLRSPKTKSGKGKFQIYICILKLEITINSFSFDTFQSTWIESPSKRSLFNDNNYFTAPLICNRYSGWLVTLLVCCRNSLLVDPRDSSCHVVCGFCNYWCHEFFIKPLIEILVLWNTAPKCF